MTSTTATLLLIDPVTDEVIIGVRGDKAWVHPGADSLPGGFMEAKFTQEQALAMEELRTIAIDLLKWKAVADEFHEGEDAETCMIREAREEMGIELRREQLVMFDARTNSRTDTRAHVTNICFYAELTPEQSALVPDGADVSHLDDLKAIKRWKIADLFLELPNIEQLYPMAFNHFDLMIGGLLKWQKEKHYNELLAEVIHLRQRNEVLEKKNTDLGWERDSANGLLNWGA
jgi:ADP-ribose pyrophosphatase YjhB (NUDIX family)